MLTAKQHELLLFIQSHLAETGISPSFDEMRDAIGLKSKSGVHRLIGALEEREFLRRLPNRARALEVLRMPEDAHRPISAEVSKISVRTNGKAEVRHLPLVGKIAAGVPIEAIEDREELAVPANLLKSGEHYALQVAGDSMVDAGILDGDYALIRKTTEAQDGQIVVALIDNENATLKYLHWEKSKVRLDPANATYQSQYYAPKQVRIQGVLAGLLRQYT